MSVMKIVRAKANREVFDRAVRHPAPGHRFDLKIKEWSSNPQRIGAAVDLAIRLGLGKPLGAPWDPIALLGTLMGAEHLLVGDDPLAEALMDAQDALIRVQEWSRSADPQDRPVTSLARQILTLAKIEQARRSRSFRAIEGPVDSADCALLVKALELVPWDRLVGNEVTILNPTFVEGSRRADGADGDILRDSTLIEIKTVKSTKVPIETIRQLALYAVLARRWGVDGLESGMIIDRVGIYHARSGTLVEWPFEECLHPGGEQALLRLFD